MRKNVLGLVLGVLGLLLAVVAPGFTCTPRASTPLDVGAEPPRGYRMVAADGGVFAFGDAKFLGSTAGMTLNGPVAGIARSPSGVGYWLAGQDGGLFAFGDAPFRGSMSGRSSTPIVGIIRSPASGYWFLAMDGQLTVFAEPTRPFPSAVLPMTRRPPLSA